MSKIVNATDSVIDPVVFGGNRISLAPGEERELLEEHLEEALETAGVEEVVAKKAPAKKAAKSKK